MNSAIIKVKKILTIAIIILLSVSLLPIQVFAISNVYFKSANKDMKIALTFDDGPHPEWTPEILDILEEYNIKATFYVIGKNAELYPDLVKREAEEGHEIGNHSYSHKFLNKCSDSILDDELKRVSSIISEIAKKQTQTLRPPGGLYNKAVEDYALENHTSIVLWSVDTLDWKRPSPNTIADNIIKNTSGGDIILMHDYISHSSPTPEALRIAIPVLIERGFEFVTVSELLKNSD